MDNLILWILSLEFLALLDWTTTGTGPIDWFCAEVGMYLKATSREYFSYVLTFRRSQFTFETGCSVICFGRGFPIWQSDVHLESFLIFQHTLWTLPWNLMVSSGIWPWGSRRACLWEMELHPNQHGVWIVFWATWATGVKMQDAGRMKATIFWYVLC